jgi:hypothetical protein
MNHRFFSPTLPAIMMAVALAACTKSVTVTSSTSTSNATTTPAAPSTSPATTTAPVSGATYSISISPTWAVGQKFDYVANDLTTSSDGQYRVHFEADGEVLALLPSGNPQKLAYTVKSLIATGPDAPPANKLPATGGKIVIEYAANGKKVITFDDKPADSDASDFLEAVLWITTRNYTDQQIFGPSDPVAVGASWPVNEAAYTNYDEENDPHYTSAEGSLTLQKVDGTGDDQTALVSGNLTLKGQNPPSDPGSFVTQLKFTASVPIKQPGVFKETMTTNSTTTPPASGPSISAGGTTFSLSTDGPTTDQEITTQEVTTH